MSKTSGPSVPETSGRLALRLLPSKVTVTEPVALLVMARLLCCWKVGAPLLCMVPWTRGGCKGRRGRLAGGQEGVPPSRQRRRGHAQPARHRLQVFAAQQPQHRVPLAPPDRKSTRLNSSHANISY